MTTVGIDAVELRAGSLKLDLAETFAPARDEGYENRDLPRLKSWAFALLPLNNRSSHSERSLYLN